MVHNLPKNYMVTKLLLAYNKTPWLNS